MLPTQATEAGYLLFIRQIMGISIAVLPDASPYIDYSFQVSLATVSLDLAIVVPGIYPLAVYNLAGDRLLNYAQDQPDSTYFKDLRQQLNLTSFVPGVIQSSSDVTTSQSFAVAQALNKLTLGDLQNLKTPYGLQYLAFAENLGTLWGLS